MISPIKQATIITKLLGAGNDGWHVLANVLALVEENLARVGEYFAAMMRAVMGALAFWRRHPPLADAGALAAFCFARASYVAQTTLYGYLRARAGLAHFNLFTDKKFTALLRPARSRLVLACLDDVAIYAAALLDAPAAHKQKLAVYVFAYGVSELADDELSAAELKAARTDFAARCELVDWAARAAPDKGVAAFAHSARSLIALAPIVDELKKYDDEIVTNSMHFKWHAVRRELRARLDGHALLASLP